MNKELKRIDCTKVAGFALISIRKINEIEF